MDFLAGFAAGVSVLGLFGCLMTSGAANAVAIRLRRLEEQVSKQTLTLNKRKYDDADYWKYERAEDEDEDDV